MDTDPLEELVPSDNRQRLNQNGPAPPGVSELIVRPPAPPLRDIVDAYVGYRMKGFPPGIHRGLPARHQTFIISIGPPIQVVRQTDPRQAPKSYRAVVSGLQATTALIQHDGTQEGVVVELTPMGSQALLGAPARALWDLSMECADVVGRTGDELWERLQGTRSWNDRFAVCDEVLCTLRGDQQVPAEIRAGWRLLVSHGGDLPVGELAAMVGYTRQHLTRRFRDEFGLGPKLAARIIRFERARSLLAASPTSALADVAARCGYYDQAHLHRDVVALAGCRPTELLYDEPLVGVRPAPPP